MQRSPSAKLFPVTDWPADRDAVVFQVITRPDLRGRQDFRALFWRDGLRQSLSFYGRNLDEQVRAARSKSVVVEVVEIGADEKVAA